MAEVGSELILLCCVAAALLAHLWAWQVLAANERLPLLVFSGSYFITSAIGATQFGLGGLAAIEAVRFGVSTDHITHLGDLRYWLLTWLPLVVPPLVAIPLCQRPATRANGPAPLLAADACSPGAYFAMLSLVSLFCFYTLWRGGFDIFLTSWQRFAGDFQELILLRYEIFAVAGSLFFGMVYVGLPALSLAALYQLRKYRSTTWWLLFGISFVITCWLSLATMQKAILLLYLITVCCALLELNVVSYRRSIPLAAAIGAVLTLLQQYFVSDWSYTQSLQHVVNRIGQSFPYYASIYPELIPHYGLDLGLWKFGYGSPPTDNIDVFNVMYPYEGIVTGNAAAPAHLRLYAQSGMAGCLGALVVIGGVLAAAIQIGRRVSGPLSFAFYMQMLVTLYYVTQTGLLDMLITSYAITWCGFTLGPIWMWTNLVKQTSRRSSIVSKNMPYEPDLVSPGVRQALPLSGNQ